jgi:GNAT superfamily N-acetyltransferase
LGGEELSVDKRAVEFACQQRAAQEIVVALTKDLDHTVIGLDVKTGVAEMLLTCLNCLVWQRDKGKIKLTFQALDEGTTFDGAFALAQSIAIPPEVRKPLNTYLRELSHFPRDAFDVSGMIRPDVPWEKFDLMPARHHHNSLRSVFVAPAVAAGLMAAPGPAPTPKPVPAFEMRPIGEADQPAVAAQVAKFWVEPRIAYTDGLIDVRSLDGRVIIDGGKVVASITWRPYEDCLHVVTLASERERRGFASTLLKEAEEEAKRQNLSRVLVSTDNANLHAMGFYQRRNYVLWRIHPGIMDSLRMLKPTIPPVANKIVIRDQIDFLKKL